MSLEFIKDLSLTLKDKLEGLIRWYLTTISKKWIITLFSFVLTNG